MLAGRLSRKPGPGDYGLAIGLALVALLGWVALDRSAPGSDHFMMLFPAVVLAGAVCGTGPAVLVGAVGAVAALLLGRTQVDALIFVPTCAAVLWATSTVRRFAASAMAAEARLAEVFRQIPGAAAILEAPDGRLLLRSTQSDAVLGQGERRVARSDDLASYGGLHADGSSFAPEEYPIVRALKTGEVVPGERLPYRKPSGELAELEVYAGPVRSPEGTILAAVGMAFDVTDRVRAERRLQQSEAAYRATAERLSAAIDIGAIGLWELDLAAGRVWLDGRFAAMLGLPAEPVTLERAAMLDFIDPADRPRASAVFAGALATGTVYTDEIRMHTTGGEDRWFVSRGAVMADVRKVVGVIRDVTQRRRREDDLRAAVAAREVLMREADHRIKNSLQLVVSLLRLQRDRVADPDVRHALDAAIARVGGVAEAHLALQRSPDLRTIDLGRILDDLCRRIGLLNPAVTVRCAVPEGVVLDAEQAIPLGLIASELLTNALRHAYPPGMAGEVNLGAVADAAAVRIVVADSGAGLPAVRPRAGLGTTVVAALARQIGATLATESTAGKGTTVTVTLVTEEERQDRSVVPPTPEGGAPPPRAEPLEPIRPVLAK